MFYATPVRRFYKNLHARHPLHPGRRWLYLKWGSVALGAGIVYFPLSFYRADTMEENGATFGTPLAVQLLEAMPLNIMSRTVGALASSEMLSPEAHQRLIRWYAWLYDIDVTESDPADAATWRTLQDFFIRKLKPEVRPVDPAAMVVSPCDGQLLKYGRVSSQNQLVQVKGCTYGMHGLLRTAPIPLADGYQRVFFSFRLAPQDYHRVHAPCDFIAHESVHVPGSLMPVMRAATRWYPMLYVNNERISINGTVGAPVADRDASTKKKKPMPAAKEPAVRQFGMALVGATNVGGIELAFDQRIRTNMPEPPPYALHWPYGEASRPAIKKGQEVGLFKFGSAVVMVMDVPADATLVEGLEGSLVKLGQPLVV